MKLTSIAVEARMPLGLSLPEQTATEDNSPESDHENSRHNPFTKRISDDQVDLS
jgi:hypothetical protein